MNRVGEGVDGERRQPPGRSNQMPRGRGLTRKCIAATNAGRHIRVGRRGGPIRSGAPDRSRSVLDTWAGGAG